jgi:transcriptional regulator with XRE-family HTH domain
MTDPDLAETLGRRLSALRAEQGLSLRALAGLCRLSVTTIHQIETGRTSPTIATLQLLAGALGIPLTAFFAQESELAPVALVRARQRSQVPVPGGALERLATGLPGQSLWGLVLSLEPGKDTGARPIVHAGQELVLCLKGTCVYSVDGGEHRLSVGDSLVFDANRPHRSHNPGARTAQVLVVLHAVGPEQATVRSHLGGRPGPRQGQALRARIGRG